MVVIFLYKYNILNIGRGYGEEEGKREDEEEEEEEEEEEVDSCAWDFFSVTHCNVSYLWKKSNLVESMYKMTITTMMTSTTTKRMIMVTSARTATARRRKDVA